MVANLLIPKTLVGRQAELNQVSAVLATDGDLLIAGMPGSGRRHLVRQAAQGVGAQVIEIDCLRATHSQKFLALLAEGITNTFTTPSEVAFIQQWARDQPFEVKSQPGGLCQIQWESAAVDVWHLFKTLLQLPQAIAEAYNCRVVIVFQNFPHIRTWDRSEVWERYLRQEIQKQSRVSYALIATVAESWVQHSEMQVVFLGPIKQDDLQPWVEQVAIVHGLQFDPSALHLFLDAVQGNWGDANSLLLRILQDAGGQGTEAWRRGRVEDPDPTFACAPSSAYPLTFSLPHPLIPSGAPTPIAPAQVKYSTLSLVKDLSLTFESLLLLLPSSQIRVLESLALDPTDTPHAREYIQKHHLSRGGGLQGALASLQQKGLVYGADYGYRITMPLLAVWLRQMIYPGGKS